MRGFGFKGSVKLKIGWSAFSRSFGCLDVPQAIAGIVRADVGILFLFSKSEGQSTSRILFLSPIVGAKSTHPLTHHDCTINCFGQATITGRAESPKSWSGYWIKAIISALRSRAIPSGL